MPAQHRLELPWGKGTPKRDCLPQVVLWACSFPTWLNLRKLTDSRLSLQIRELRENLLPLSDFSQVLGPAMQKKLNTY